MLHLITVNQGKSIYECPKRQLCQINDPCLAKSYNNPPPDVTKSLLKLVTVLVFCLLLSFSIFFQ